jgi:AbrB family looped-hinge helix DNA binding protein
MATATLSPKFEISIPKEVRDRQNWEPGQKFVFIPEGKDMVRVPVPTREASPRRPPGYRSNSSWRRSTPSFTQQARLQEANLLTCDAHFENLPHVTYVPKPEAKR